MTYHSIHFICNFCKFLTRHELGIYKEIFMKTRQLKLLSSAGAIAMILATANANATLEYLGPVDLTGTGLGNVNTLLTIQSPANTTTESGSVSWNGSSNVTTGDTQAINNTLSLST